jgi:hypothetical protein
MPFLNRTVIFFVYANIRESGKPVISPHIAHTDQPGLALTIVVAVPFLGFTRSANQAIIIVTRRKRAGNFFIDADINIPPVVKAGSQILTTNQPFPTFLIPVTVPFTRLAGTTKLTIVIVSRFDRAGRLCIDTNIHKLT